MNLASLFPFEKDGVPVIEFARSAAEGAELDGRRAYSVISARVFVHDYNFDLVTDPLDVNVENLVPFWRLARPIEGSCLQSLRPRLNLDVGVHLTNPFRIPGQSCFHQVHLDGS